MEDKSSHQSSSDNQDDLSASSVSKDQSKVEEDDLSASSVSKDQSEVEDEKENGVKPSKTRKRKVNTSSFYFCTLIYIIYN
jgi:hypothetical protein